MLLDRLVSLVAPPLCWSCGTPARPGEPLCFACRRELRWLGTGVMAVAGVATWAPVGYDGPARQLVAALKFRGAAGLAEAMAAQMVASAPPSLLEGRVLVPVPLEPRRLRRRGFNQAERLASAVVRRTELPLVDCLRRRPGGGPQVGRSRAARLTAVRDSVSPAPGRTVPRDALLVDDVITTGGTLAACAAALRDAGADEVRAIVYARTFGR